MIEEFLLRAALGGLGVAALCGPLGCLVVWQRMAYYGATLAHAALLGVALGLFLQISIYLAIIAVCMLIAVLLMSLEHRRELAVDTLLGILAHATLAMGLLVLGFLPGNRVDLMGYLFGDILSLTWPDLAIIYGVGVVVGGVLGAIWRPILALIVQHDLARVEGVAPYKIRLVFLLLLSIVVALALQLVGILLIVSLLIIPPATARHFATSPEQMAAWAMGLGMAALLGGLTLSWRWDLAAGPAVVVTASGLYLCANALSLCRRR